MKTLKTLVVAAALAATGAQAQVIDFDELAHESFHASYQTIVADGFLFGGSFGHSNQLGVWGRNEGYQADRGNASVFINHGGNVITMNQVGGSAFDFASIDLADVYNAGNASTFQFTFNYAAGGSSSAQVSLDNLAGLQTFSFNQAGLSSVSWQNIAGDGGWGQFDNVNITPIAAPVPEPETYALMLAGLGAVAWVARRRRPQQ
jgi:PEP-CTERM motif